MFRLCRIIILHSEYGSHKSMFEDKISAQNDRICRILFFSSTHLSGKKSLLVREERFLVGQCQWQFFHKNEGNIWERILEEHFIIPVTRIDYGFANDISCNLFIKRTALCKSLHNYILRSSSVL